MSSAPEETDNLVWHTEFLDQVTDVFFGQYITRSKPAQYTVHAPVTWPSGVSGYTRGLKLVFPVDAQGNRVTSTNSENNMSE